MICTLTARRINDGARDDFRAAFEGSAEDIPPEVNKRWKQVFICRDVADPEVMLTFGFFDGTLEELREVQARFDRDAQVSRLEPYVADVLLDGSYEVLEEITP
jgi:hypothetical protein